MATLTLRTSQSTALTHAELDANFQALNNQIGSLLGDVQTEAGNASTSATNAANSASAAQTAETNAETAETNAETAETNAASSASSASTSASTATTQASNASTSASNAATSESNAATSASNAATSETNAAASAASVTTLPAPVASGFGRLTVQNDADDDYEHLAQGTNNQILKSNGSNALPAFEDEDIVVTLFFQGSPDASTEIFRFVFPFAVTTAEDFGTDSQGEAGTGATAATRSFPININGSTYGDVEISTEGTGGLATFLTDSATPAAISAGDVLTISSPSTVDDIADIALTMAFKRA